MRTWLVGWSVLWLVAACTDDFDRYRFTNQELPDAGRLGRGSSTEPSAENELPESPEPSEGDSANPGDSSPPTDPPPDEAAPIDENPPPESQPPESGADGSAGTSGMSGSMSEAAGSVALPSEEPGEPPDAGTPADTDAQITMPPPPPPQPTTQEVCVTAVDTLREQPSGCSGCTCERCQDAALDCLVRGSEQENALCRAVWQCAIRSGCRDWDCYCKDQNLRCTNTTSEVGDGPCAEEMNAAALGGRLEVNDAHMEFDLHAELPLVRALKARGCTVGLPPGPTGLSIATNSMCRDACYRN